MDSRVDDPAALAGLIGRGKQVEVVDVARRAVSGGNWVVDPAGGGRGGGLCSVPPLGACDGVAKL